jgi:pyrroloquinoline quinone biosynthesis protein D
MQRSALRADHVLELNPTYLFRWEEAQQSYVLLYPEGLVKLNATAGEILQLVAGARRVDAIVAELAAKYGDEDVADDVLAFLESSYDKGWIRTKP